MKFNKAKAKRKLDRLFSRYILTRDNRTCQRCLKTNCKVDTSHIIPRNVLVTRWNPDNAITLCVGCHKYGNKSWHQNPLLAVRWLDSVRGIDNNNNLILLADTPFTLNQLTYNNIAGKLNNNL